ncbi:hypothetical protein CRUP_023485 [Coryphaenoides rupestris]|nr:hypothetical protein CRUP_023485 [Coryphaenoides rupestris]
MRRTSSLSQLPMEDLKEPLPPQWRCYMSPQGRRYYVNTASNETTWERPSSVPGTPKSSMRHKNSLPAGAKQRCQCVPVTGGRRSSSSSAVRRTPKGSICPSPLIHRDDGMEAHGR